MKYEVFYSIGEYKDSIIIEGETIDDVRENVANEMEKRNADYNYSILLED